MTQPSLSISRGFQPDERAQAGNLFWQAFAGKLGRIMSPPDKARAFFAATLDPSFCLCARNAKGELLGLAGFKTAQGGFAGAGSALLSAVKDETRARNLSNLRLDVIDTNPRARALYERQGFVALADSNTGPLRWLFGFSTATTMVWTAQPPE